MTPAIAIFDIGKTNKKVFLFDEDYHIIFEKAIVIPEIQDEDGFHCENLQSLTSFVLDSFHEIIGRTEFDVKAVNFSAYGASFVFTSEDDKPVCPLYNYLKPYPPELLKQFYNKYGGEKNFAFETASPVLGNLNSGMQLYRIKYENPDLFTRISRAYHLPQYVSHLLCGAHCSDITSIGCHTNLWDFKMSRYHDWVTSEGIDNKLLSILPSTHTSSFLHKGKQYKAGIGLHDSSAALIPYLFYFKEPFVLISTGTWCISLSPFNTEPLTLRELDNDCLCYLQYNARPVKAARLFAGHIHDQQIKRIADHFNTDVLKFNGIRFNSEMISRIHRNNQPASVKHCEFEKRDLSQFSSDEEAYHQLMFDIIKQQYTSTNFILNAGVKKLFVDGGFSKNEIYMKLLASSFPQLEVYATSMAQASALGAALAIHDAWNQKPIRKDIIEMKPF